MVKQFKLQRTLPLALQIHNLLSHLQFFNLGKIMITKYGHLMLPGAFPDKETPDIILQIKQLFNVIFHL